MAPCMWRFWPIQHRFFSVNNWFWEWKWYSEVRVIIFKCICGQTEFWWLRSAQLDVHIFFKMFLHRRQMTLPKQSKSHTCISKSAQSDLLFLLFNQFTQTIGASPGCYWQLWFRQLFSICSNKSRSMATGLIFRSATSKMLCDPWLPVATRWGFYFGRFVCLLQLPIERRNCAQASSQQPKSYATFWPFIKPGLVWISVGRWRFSRWFRRWYYDSLTWKNGSIR